MKLKVFYNTNQSVKDNNSFSPSAGKPALIATEFAKNPNVEIVSQFQPLSLDELCVAHDRTHVEDVLNGRKNNGFMNTLDSVAKSLPWTNGSFYAAAKYALENKTVTMSPTSGFHHAGYDSCEGYCTFNGLATACVLLKKNCNVERIGIIDYDCHYGNGTVEIIGKLGLYYVEHQTFGEYATRLNVVDGFDKWLDRMDAQLEYQFADCNVLLYQAGADPHVEDPFGGFLTTEQMRRRDETVFRVAKRLGIPLVWNLAGGYQKPVEKVIQLHVNTLTECLKAYGV